MESCVERMRGTGRVLEEEEEEERNGGGGGGEEGVRGESTMSSQLGRVARQRRIGFNPDMG